MNALKSFSLESLLRNFAYCLKSKVSECCLTNDVSSCCCFDVGVVSVIVCNALYDSSNDCSWSLVVAFCLDTVSFEVAILQSVIKAQAILSEWGTYSKWITPKINNS